VDGGDRRLGDHDAGEPFDEVLHFVATQPTKADQLTLAGKLAHRPAAARWRRLDVAGGPHHQQPQATKVAGQELEQEDGGLVGRVEVVQDDQQRLDR
jgi:hypothetical protein